MSELKKLNIDKVSSLLKGMTREQITVFLYEQKQSGKASRIPGRIGMALFSWLNPDNFTIEELKANSPIEEIMRLELMSAKIPFEWHKKISSYEVDFAITHKGLNIIVECDGEEWHTRTDEQVARDKKRDKKLLGQGWIVLRFSGSDLYRNPAKCVERVKLILGM